MQLNIYIYFLIIGRRRACNFCWRWHGLFCSDSQVSHLSNCLPAHGNWHTLPLFCNHGHGRSIHFPFLFPLPFPTFHFFLLQISPSLPFFPPSPPSNSPNRFPPPLPHQILHSDPRPLQLQSPKLPHVSAKVSN